MAQLFRHTNCIAWACALLPAFAATYASAAPAAEGPAAVKEDSARSSVQAREYSVINLAPLRAGGLLNERGEVAMTMTETLGVDNSVTTFRFFDGRRIRDYGSFAGRSLGLVDFNDNGMAVGRISPAAEPFNPRAFTWTAAHGLRILPSPATAAANAVNNLNWTVGWAGEPATASRAVLWTNGGARITLGPPAPQRSEASAINLFGFTVGSAFGADGISRAILWSPLGSALDLGMIEGGTGASATHINTRGEVAGNAGRQTQSLGFYWSRERGMVPITADNIFRTLSVVDLNEFGDVAGNTLISDGQGFFAPYVWSLGAGYRQLPLAGAPSGNLYGLNNRREVVGDLQLSIQDRSDRRAALWNGVVGPVDLNTRLVRAPAGLVLNTATAVNDRGEILADSNAGLVLLRPGRQGTPAPVLGPITGIPQYAQITRGDTVDLTAAFVDSSIYESHTATASVNDGCPQNAPSLREVRGAGEVNLRHTFCRAGSVTVRIKVRDRAGNESEVALWHGVREPNSGTQPQP